MIQYLSHSIEKSRAIISQMLSLCSNPYLALSFGKDSLVMLDLVREQYPDVPCLFLCSEETMFLSNYKEMILTYSKLGANIKIVEMKHINHDFEKNAKNNEFTQDEFYKYNGVFMGIRICESKARRVTLVSPDNNMIGYRIMMYKTGQRNGQYRCCPLSDWSDDEVFAYVESKNIVLPDCYSEFNKRSSAQLPSGGLFRHGLQRLAMKDIESFNKVREMIFQVNFNR